MFLRLRDTHFPPENRLHKISYSCTQNIAQIMRGHNKKVTQIKRYQQLECNCNIKTEGPLKGDYLIGKKKPGIKLTGLNC